MAGGGGQPDKLPVSHGTPPKFAPEQLNPPKVQVEDAKLTPPVTVDVDPNLKMTRNDALPIGMPNSPLVGLSMGNGRGGSGIGSGEGGGMGPGGGGGTGNGLRRIGGGVSAPVVLFAPEPGFSEEARKAKVSGIVKVDLQVDTNGRPTHVRVIRGIGMGLDEKAIEAVQQYKFKPAMENGKPVPVEMNVDVVFTIY
jgi:protein TonB